MWVEFLELFMKFAYAFTVLLKIKYAKNVSTTNLQTHENLIKSHAFIFTLGIKAVFK